MWSEHAGGGLGPQPTALETAGRWIVKEIGSSTLFLRDTVDLAISKGKIVFDYLSSPGVAFAMRISLNFHSQAWDYIL